MLGCSGMELWVCSSAFLLLICFFPTTKTSSDPDHFQCGPGLGGSLGVTVPYGDIRIHYGSPLEIYCMLKPSETKFYNSSSLTFFRNDVEVSNEFVTRVNDTTIRLYIKNPPPSRSVYYCKLKTSSRNLIAVCLNYVLVGYPPSPVQNFTCISRSWLSLNCSWVPVNNYIKTYYRLYYYEPPKRKIQYHCPGETPFVRNYCVWNESSEPLYRAVLESLYFNMYIWNDLGNITTTYKIDHFAVVIPYKAVNLSLVEATSDSLCIEWERPLSLYTFPAGIVTRVMYQSEWDQVNQWHLVNTSHLKYDINRFTLNITGLMYAHTLFDIRVLLKSVPAKDEPKWWSEPATITLRTKAT
uniref:Fibronectin type-III domain-containing protein n=2 Tax=Rhodnius prolixus TaxID=13249 RepID=T1HH20_RHOPR